MSLYDQIDTSVKLPIAYVINPYKAQNQVISFGNRFMANVTQIVPVQDVSLMTSLPHQQNRLLQGTDYNRPAPFQWVNGSAPIAGNNTPGRKGI